MVVLRFGMSTIPANGTAPECRTIRIKAIGWAVAQHKKRQNARKEAAAKAEAQAVAQKNAAVFSCPACECKNDQYCRNGGHEWTGFEGTKYVKLPKAANGDEVWQATATKIGWQYCKCRRTSTISYRPSLKKEFVAVKSAMNRLQKASQGAKKSSRKRASRKSRR